MRALIETLDDAYCEDLRRIAIGELDVEDCGPEPIAIGEALAFLPERVLSAPEAAGVEHGRAVEIEEADQGTLTAEDGIARLTREGRLLAVARRRGELLRPEVVLA